MSADTDPPELTSLAITVESTDAVTRLETTELSLSLHPEQVMVSQDLAIYSSRTIDQTSVGANGSDIFVSYGVGSTRDSVICQST